MFLDEEDDAYCITNARIVGLVGRDCVGLDVPMSLVGAEGPGLSVAAMTAATHRIRIPMTEGTDSVNVATAAAIALAALYERHS